MFKIDELREFTASREFSIIKANLDMFLLKNRLGIRVNALSTEMINTLSYFATAVIGSISRENDEDEHEWRILYQIAADIEYGLYLLSEYKANEYERLRRASILYELAGLPGIAASTLNPKVFSPFLYSFFSRKRDSAFGYLGADNEPLLTNSLDDDYKNYDNILICYKSNIAQKGLDETLSLLADYMQNFKENSFKNAIMGASLIAYASKRFNLSISADETTALMKVIKERGNSSISRFISKGIVPDIVKAGLPAELWPVQQYAIKGGMLSEEFKSWGLASPTGTGKTSLAQLLLIDFFHKHPDKKAFYIVPSRALSAQVAKDLTTVLKPLGLKVGALGSHLTYHEQVVYDPKEMNVLVFTPEKADLIIRIEPELLKETLLVIVDEAHHIEAGTRGILLEFYLWRLRSLVSSSCRIIQLSAVAPNINELVGWLGEDLDSSYVKLDWRTGRLRIGIFEREADGAGILNFNDNLTVNLFKKGSLPYNANESLAVLADTLAASGIILVLATSKGKPKK